MHFIDPQDRSQPFHQRVFAAVCQVPAGYVATYGDIGSVLGSPRLARQIGWALSSLAPELHPEHQTIPWHRIINAQGAISYRGDLERAEKQLQRLEAEGVLFDEHGFCDLRRHRWSFVDQIDQVPIKQPDR
ncbi:MAG: hypothetical protein CMP23_13525 [Rickettsiales bacterium]|nr:hypothetical protein [Rickettsiales bacterium]|tara:strand:+ start:559 stop:951 length:393 start_codon:yes stop_codon:yes gene_type:complete